MSNLILGRWVRGEAEDRGITLSDSEIDNQLEEIKKQLGGEKGFQRTLEQAKLMPEQARSQVELQLLGDQIQSEVIPQDAPPDISEAQIEDYYEFNKVQFEQPETRDLRQIVNKDEAKVQQAKSILGKDDSAKGWQQAAARYTTDEATQNSGGFRPAVARGQDLPALEEQIFTAAQGELVGPFEVEGTFDLIQVKKSTPAKTTTLDQASKQIEQQLGQGAQQQVAQDFQQDFTAKWTARDSFATAATRRSRSSSLSQVRGAGLGRARGADRDDQAGVRRRGGLGHQETFKKTLAVYQVLPGPEAHELCVYFGRLRAGRLGAFSPASASCCRASC